MREIKASEALMQYAIGGLPEGYRHIFDFFMARKAGRPAPPEAERAIVRAFEVMLSAASSEYAGISSPDWQKINYFLLTREVVPREKPRTAEVLAAFAEALGLNKAAGPAKKPLKNFDLALAVARLVVRGRSQTSAVRTVARKQPRGQHVDKTQTVERAWRRFQDLAKSIAETEKRNRNMQKQLKKEPGQIGRAIGQIATDLGGALFEPDDRVKN